MNLRHLRYFLEMVEQGSLSLAAQHLHVAQSALSLHLRNMEESVGTALVTRYRTGVVPTEAGTILARHARIMLAEHERVLEEIRSMDKDPAGEVRLGLPGTISEILTVPLLEAVRKKYPGIRLIISEAMSGFILDWLRDGQVDLAVLYVEPEDSEISSMRLLEEELVLVGTAATLHGTMTQYCDLASKPFILPSKVHDLRKMIEAAFREHGQSLAPVLEVDSYKNIKTLVKLGHGISILPLHAVERERETGEFVIQTLPSAGLFRSAYLSWRTLRPATRFVSAIHTLLPEVVGNVISSCNWPGSRSVIRAS